MSLQDKVNEANAAFGAGNYDVALQHYDEAIELAGGKAGALSILYANKGAVLQRMKRLDDSITALTKSLEYNPKHTEALYNKGVALKSKGMYVLQSRAPWHVRVGQVGGEIR
jgi:tetratricopeptide (TPR) repeat protein